MIREVDRTVYYSPRRRRHFLTARAAARAEATARMRLWWPTEQAEYEGSGRMTYQGWCFEEEPRLVAARDRLTDRYLRQLKASTRAALQEAGNE